MKKRDYKALRLEGHHEQYDLPHHKELAVALSIVLGLVVVSIIFGVILYSEFAVVTG